MNKITRKYAQINENQIEKISLSLATSLDVLEWSYGEVTKPETVNYKSYKPERFGLFDEVIFGPTSDYKCPICGKKYKSSNEGSYCEATDICKFEKAEILPKISRRSRMGHIKLQTPVVHFWFFKVDNSIIAKLLGLKSQKTNKPYSRAAIKGLIYYKSHIVVESGDVKSLAKNKIIEINEAAVIYRDALEEIQEMYKKGGSRYDKNHKRAKEAYEEIAEVLIELQEIASSRLGQDYGIDFYELNEIIEEYSNAKILTGSKSIEYLLKNFNLKKERDTIQKELDKISKKGKEQKLTTSKIQDRKKLYERMKVINSFIASGQKPESMLIYNLPIIPADLRPLIQLDGGRHSTSDINELYRRIIIRNNRLKKWKEAEAPNLIIQNELRMIQEAVDALIDNARRSPSPVVSKDNRPLKSISDALTGKKGRFRQNLLGKRVDYSGRSVIVVGPELKMHQAGIPREMAAKLFEPWIIHELIKNEISSSIKSAKKLIEDLKPIIWPHVEKVIKGKPILLNRAPTLHRLSIQAFEPILIRGKAIKLHPLVTTAFNADFDGDQMAVHVPISAESIREAKELMYANRNILGPKDGEPIINPSQDIILGLYFLTKEKAKVKGEGNIYYSFHDALKAYEFKKIDLHTRIVLPTGQLKENKISEHIKGYSITTIGKLIFNRAFPEKFEYIFAAPSIDTSQFKLEKALDFKKYIKNLPIVEPLNKKDIAKIIRHVFDLYVPTTTIGDIAIVIEKLEKVDRQKLINEFSKLKNYQNKVISKKHVEILTNLTIIQYDKLLKLAIIQNPEVESLSKISDKVDLLEAIWFEYNNIVASMLDKIKSLGFEYSTKSGITMAISDIIISNYKEEYINEGDQYINRLKIKYEDGFITDDERYTLSISKWTEIKKLIQDDLNIKIQKEKENSIFMMMLSGARGNISNFVQLAGLRGLMTNNVKTLKADAENDRIVRSTVEVPIKSSFLEGLSAYEFYSSTHGARKGLTDTALNTARSGYLTRRLVDVAQNIVVSQNDCETKKGFIVKDIVDTRTGSIIVNINERIEGRYLNKDVISIDGKQIAKANNFVTKELANVITNDYGIKKLEIRSILACRTKAGVCKKCYGKDLSTNKIVTLGEAVGIIAAQSIGEPGTQLTMQTFHTGGVAGVDDITGGFGRLIELIDAYEKPWGNPASISNWNGEITNIKLSKEDINKREIKIKINSDKNTITKTKIISIRQQLRIKVGDIVKAGQKLTEGPIILKQLLKATNPITVQSYLLKEIQRIYRMQGIAISDKYIEIIIRQMLSKAVINHIGDSTFFTGSIVNVFDLERENEKLEKEGKTLAIGEVQIRGAKQSPLLSDSFLAAASYQETSKILVHAAISNRVDKLKGLKENIIVGHKIPAGTGTKFEDKSKYDLRDPYSYFSDQTLTQNNESITKDLDKIMQEEQNNRF